jgi:hypothetical protein
VGDASERPSRAVLFGVCSFLHIRRSSMGIGERVPKLPHGDGVASIAASLRLSPRCRLGRPDDCDVPRVRDSCQTMIDLSDVIADLRGELDAARRAGEGEQLRFELGPVELEVSVVVQKEVGGDAKVKFWVVELGADGKLSSTATQRIKLTLIPRLTAAAAANAPAMADQPAYIAGPTEAGER